jgi:endoglucanase
LLLLLLHFRRTVHIITNSSSGGSDALAAAAGALAAAHVALNSSRSALAAKALNHAKQLYSMALSVQLLNSSYCGAVVPCQGEAVPSQDGSLSAAAAAAAAAGSENVTAVPWVAYPSSSKYDDLAWAAAWLFKATGTTAYLSEAELFYKLHLQHEAQLGTPAGWIPSTDNMGFAAGGQAALVLYELKILCAISSLVRSGKQWVHLQDGSPATNTIGFAAGT